MEGLKTTRRTLKGRLTRLQTYLDGVERPTKAELQIRVEGLESIWIEYNQMHAGIMSLNIETEMALQEDEYAETEARYYTLKAALRERLSGFSERRSSGTADTAIGDVKLPRIVLPKFSGNYLEWSSFYDLFTSLIHQNEKIVNAQKLHYLKSALEGEAAGLLQALEVTDANYGEAWTMLKDRYQSRRRLTQCHLSALFNQKHLQSESANDMRRLLDNTVKHVRALSALEVKTEDWDPVLVFLMTEKLDTESRRQWELSSPSADFPKFSDLKAFVEQRCRALEASNFKQVIKTKPIQPATNKKQSASSYIATSQQSVKCEICGGNHFSFRCSELLKLGPRDRSSLIKSHNLCFNCLRSGHSVRDCNSSANCKKCDKRHNTLLHFESDERKPSSSERGDTREQEVLNQFAKNVKETQVLLSTAKILVKDGFGENQTCRALLDSGSEASFITEACIQRLGLKRVSACVRVVGVAQVKSGSPKGKVSLHVMSHTKAYSTNVEAFIMPKLTGLLPVRNINKGKVAEWTHLRYLVLADPEYYNSAEIDIILGADVFGEIVLEEKVPGKTGMPVAYNTQFGWVITGKTGDQTSHLTSYHTTVEPYDPLKRFWELEEMHQKLPLTKEEESCEIQFASTVQRDSAGRYCVQLPFKEDSEDLGLSKETVIRRFLNLEKRLQVTPKLQEQYNTFMEEYLSLGHMELVPAREQREMKNKTNYLPHHIVLKEDSATTKLRVVFDASAVTSSGVSLNDKLLVGPKIQEDVWDILMRFRFHNYVMSADIEKMFRQIKVSIQDGDLQRIVWRPSPQSDIQHYRLVTVTYGTASAPFLAQRTLHQLAQDEGDEYPLARRAVLQDFYMDNILTGARDLDEALLLQRQLIDITKSGGFSLRQWASNESRLLSSFSKDLCEQEHHQVLPNDEGVKTLGVYWNTEEDCFFYDIKLPEVGVISKRAVLSDIGKMFDPLGWLAPVVLNAKIFMQQLWIAGVSWDEMLGSDLSNEWVKLREQLSKVRNVLIPRCVILKAEEVDYELHGFADASEKAYGAVLYLLARTPGQKVKVSLLCAKTRVAPVKQVSLPRLELCAAVLLCQLIKKVHPTLIIPVSQIWAWTDSMVALGWIRGTPRRWKTFVANRVTLIQDTLDPSSWSYLPSRDNPADMASRGCNTTELCNNTLWWNGPQWLDQRSCWPKTPSRENSLCKKEQKTCNYVSTNEISNIKQPWEYTLRFSSLSRLQRVTAFCLRFVGNCKSSRDTRQLGPLTTLELSQALLVHVRKVQEEHFGDTIACIKRGKQIPKELASLSPFLDQDDILRVGGRIRHAKIPADQRFPILLPGKHHLSVLIVRDTHVKLLHAGLQATLAGVNQKFWITRGRSVVRKVTHECQICFRDRAENVHQLMGDLPRSRLEPVRPFIRCGVDYGGPLKVKACKGRGGKIYKAYFALFVCFTTKAIHIELVMDLTSDAMIASLKRFMARRGKPTDIYSDNGTNFIGANRELKQLNKQFQSQFNSGEISDFLSKDNTAWHFIPARAPHFGGLWEAGIKSAKTHLRRIVGNTLLTVEELMTTLAQVEAILNSRPLCPLSNDPGDLEVLTPGHFLIGEPLSTTPEPNLLHLQVGRLSRWQLVQRMQQHFWSRWRQEYLNQLQQRKKWNKKQNNLKCGDLVLVKDNSLPSLSWPRGRVVETHAGKDELVRVVTVKTSAGLFRRPVVNLCLLPSC